jgi:hypothetical protein
VGDALWRARSSRLNSGKNRRWSRFETSQTPIPRRLPSPLARRPPPCDVKGHNMLNWPQFRAIRRSPSLDRCFIFIRFPNLYKFVVFRENCERCSPYTPISLVWYFLHVNRVLASFRVAIKLRFWVLNGRRSVSVTFASCDVSRPTIPTFQHGYRR